MDEFIPSLKEIYRERLLQCDEQWPPVRGEKLLNLQLVETDKTDGFGGDKLQRAPIYRPTKKTEGDGFGESKKVKRTPILHSHLFKTDSGRKPVRKIVVEGNAGMGKTTLCTMLAEGWAEGKFLTQFDCVLLLPLRDSRVSSATSLPELIEHLHSDEDVCKGVISTLKKRAGKGVLIIADGWDELDNKKRSKDSFLYKFLFGNLLPLGFALLTSRPSASAPLHKLKCVHRLVEVVGFDKENIEHYIQSEFDDCHEKASSLIKQLESNPLIQSVCSVPLNCAIVCHLWHTLNQSLPTTMTELYTQIVLNVIFRDISKNSPDCNLGLSLTNFDSIPQHLQESFWLTCKFAYECLCRDQIVFSEDELTSFFPEFLASNIKFLCFGLLQSARSLLPVGHGLSFHFAHLTIQEFLAALHLVTLSNEKKLKVVKDRAKNDRFDMVWRFVFGLATKRQNDYSLKCYVDAINPILNGLYFVRFLKQLCHCALESLPTSLTTAEDISTVTLKAARIVDGNFYLSGGTPHDVTAALRVLRYTKRCTNVVFYVDECGMSDKQLEELTDILSIADASGLHLISHLDLSNHRLSYESVIRFLDNACPILSSLKRLYLSKCNIVNIQPQLISSFV